MVGISVIKQGKVTDKLIKQAMHSNLCYIEELQAEHPKASNGSEIKILEHCTVAVIQLVLLLAVSPMF